MMSYAEREKAMSQCICCMHRLPLINFNSSFSNTSFVFFNLPGEMRIKAFILLLCFFVYFVDSFAAAKCSAIKPTKTMCCKQMKAKHSSPQKCPGKSKDDTSGCFNCPLCYITALPSDISFSVQSFLIEKIFGLLQQSKLHSYHSSVWKPPNKI